MKRSFLFLQGPHGSFFKHLGDQLKAEGHIVTRVNLCGGDWYDWKTGSLNYRGRASDWALWLSSLMAEKGVTDLLIYGDWRPYHREAVYLAKLKGIQVWAFDEGYLRPNWITIEEGGVNGNSELSQDAASIKTVTSTLKYPKEETYSNPLIHRQILGFLYAAFSVVGVPFYPFFRTHRPYSHLREMTFGWIPRILNHSRIKGKAERALSQIGKEPYFFFPLQLDADSQVRLYSPFTGMKEAIAYVLTSFAKSAPKTARLVIKNHPLDNGLICYERFIRSFSRSCGIENRVIFVDKEEGKELLQNSSAVVLINSTMGLQAL